MKNINNLGNINNSWDIAIIGGGPGGYVAAISAAQLGAKVCVIERDRVGGTCLNYGCIPTKALYRNAEVLHTIKNSKEFGIHIDNFSIDIDIVHQRKNRVVESLVTGVEKLLVANDIDVFKGDASFVNKNELSVTLSSGEKQRIPAKNIIIATGSEPSIPNFQGTDLEGVYTSKEMLEFSEVPKRLAIIGGGVIGLEFASVFNALGTEVTVIEYGPSILGHLDKDISKRLANMLKKSGVNILTNTKVTSISQQNEQLKVTGETSKGEILVVTDNVLIASGRKPVTKGLKLDNIGVDYSNRGIGIDKNFMTNIEGIYAIGDVNGKMMLAHAASHQGVSAVEHILGHENLVDHDTVPGCIFTFPEIASVGITEREAKENKLEYKVSKFGIGGNGKALTLGESNGFVKVLADMEDKIIGVQILGPHASDLIHEGTLAVSNKMSAQSITQTIHAHPTLSESFHEAVLGLNGKAIHSMPNLKTKKRQTA